MTITTTDGFTFELQADGTYSDGFDSYTARDILTNGRDSVERSAV